MYPITTVTGSIVAIFYIYISITIIKFRYQYRVSLGSQGHDDLERAIRAHGNFAEYTPLTLILMLCAEANHAHWSVAGLIAITFVLGRLFHAYAFIINTHHFKYRKRGMYLTFASIFSLSLLNIVLVALPYVGQVA